MSMSPPCTYIVVHQVQCVHADSHIYIYVYTCLEYGPNNFGRSVAQAYVLARCIRWSIFSNIWGHVRTSSNGMYVCGSIQNSSVSPICYMSITHPHASRMRGIERASCERQDKDAFKGRGVRARDHLELRSPSCIYVPSHHK